MSEPDKSLSGLSPSMEKLELEALVQRNHLHQSVAELKSHVSQVRNDMDPKENARKHFVVASIAVTVLGLACGYSFGGIFSR